MKIGLIGRADERGLGHITREFYRHVQPARTLIVQPTLSRHEQHREWYQPTDESRVSYVTWGERRDFPDEPLGRWMSGLDVIYGAETFYDDRVPRLAREAGVATVLHVNPEFYRRGVSDQATAVWNQSPWLHDRLRGDAEVVPIPVATDRFSPSPPNKDGLLRVLHIAGNVAAHDRNGTVAAVAAAKRCTGIEFTVMAQGRLPGVPSTVRPSGDYWTLYSGFDVLVMPRRYAGQCLPVQEALAAGLAVVMTDCPPNDWWPIERAAATPGGTIKTPGGKVPVFNADVAALADAIQRFADDREALTAAREAGLAWARANSWESLLGEYLSRLEATVKR